MVGHTGVIPAAVDGGRGRSTPASATCVAAVRGLGRRLHRHRRPRQLRPHARARRLAQHRPLAQPGAADRHRRGPGAARRRASSPTSPRPCSSCSASPQPEAMTGRSLIAGELSPRSTRRDEPDDCGSRSRRATAPRAPGVAAHRPRAGRDAGLHPAGDEGDGARAGIGGGRRARLRADPRQHLPPVRLAGAGADRRRRRAARLHGLGAGADHRLGRLPGLLARPRRRRRRGQGQRPAGRRARLGGLDRRGGGALPLLPRRRRAVHLARGLDAGAGGARLRHRPRLRRVHALPRRPRVHRPLDRAHPPLARPLPRVARARGARARRRSSGSSRAASTRTCGANRRRRSPRPASTGSRSAAPSAATRRRCARCWR